MTSVAVPAPAPLTRRQLRELERAREAAELAEAGAAPELPAAPTDALADDLDVVAPVIDHLPMGATPSEELTEHLRVTVSRRDLRRPAQPTGTRAGRMAPRAAILTSLGALTIAAPLTGFVSSSSPAAAIGPMIPTEVSVLDTVDSAAAARTLEGSLPTGAALQYDSTAVTRAAELASRQQARTGVPACAPVEGASGLREAYTERDEVLYRPMMQGTYRDTSVYGPRWGSYHYGTDMAAPVGTAIYAVAKGEVIYAGGGKEGRSGQLIIIHHVIDCQDVWSWYGHMYSDGVYVAEGETVTAGQLIAGVGSNGRSSGPHLHFEIHVGELENHRDPLAFLAGAEAPFPAAA